MVGKLAQSFLSEEAEAFVENVFQGSNETLESVRSCHRSSRPSYVYLSKGLMSKFWKSRHSQQSQVANWADTITHTQPWSVPLHFINVQECSASSESCTFDYERDCEGDVCVAGAIANYTERLLSKIDPYTDLKFLTHFVGDVHQPLHCARASDRGGNTISPILYSVTDQGDEWDLHQVWDFGMIENHVHNNFGGINELYYQDLLKAVSPGGTYYDSLFEWTSCPPSSSACCSSKWGQESVDLSLSKAYVTTDGEQISGNFTVPGDYVGGGIEVVSMRLAQAGVRLAQILEALAGEENATGSGPLRMLKI